MPNYWEEVEAPDPSQVVNKDLHVRQLVINERYVQDVVNLAAESMEFATNLGAPPHMAHTLLRKKIEQNMQNLGKKVSQRLWERCVVGKVDESQMTDVITSQALKEYADYVESIGRKND